MVPRGDDEGVRLAQGLIAIPRSDGSRGPGGRGIDDSAVHGHVGSQSAEARRHLAAEGMSWVIGRVTPRGAEDGDPSSEDASAEGVGGEPDDVVPLSEAGRVEVRGVDR